MRHRVIPASTYRRVAWNNGGGTTADIDVVQADGTMLWRLSIAEIERDGPFSDFAGYDRTIVPIWGCGVRLDIAGAGIHELSRRFVPFRFDGGCAVGCELIAGPVRAFNAMSRRGTHRHELVIHDSARAAEVVDQAEVRYVTSFCHAAVVNFPRARTTLTLAAGETVRVDGIGRMTVATMNARGVVAVIAIFPR